MDSHSISIPQSKLGFKPPIFWKNGRFVMAYLVLMALPFVATYALDMQEKAAYAAFLSLFNTLAIMVFYIQFPLVGRLKHIAPFANINWSMALHRKTGQWLGMVFLLHPVLILAPRFLMSFDEGLDSLMTTIAAPQMLTGDIAWVAMMVWVLLAVFRRRLKMSYEVFRLTHMLGFVLIAVLSTLHITSVGSHGQFESQFNGLWWVLCMLSVGLVLYNHAVKPLVVRAYPFKLVDVKPVSTRDWQLIIEAPTDAGFDFEPGQFVWLNTSASGGVKDHPFSIASARSALPQVSFLIRNLGDYTSKLNELKIGQTVYVDGPYGSISLDDAKRAKAIVLIAGGAGIGPMLSLLRGLAERQDARPVRLIYGNNRLDQMVLQEEIKALEDRLPNFKQQLVCDQSEGPKGDDGDEGIYHGVVDQTVVARVLGSHAINDWAVYLCGPEPMIDAVNKTLKQVGVSSQNVHYERLSF